MAEPVVVAAVQPPYLDVDGERLASETVLEEALELTSQAASEGARLIVLPETLNVMNSTFDEAVERAETVPGPLSERVVELCERHGCVVLLPILERRGDELHNSAWLLAPTGPVFGYDKVHLTLVERRDYGITPGDDFHVGNTPWGAVGVMTCYDAHFPETAACLAQMGADMIAYPALERSLPADRIRLLVQSRAWDHAAVVVRASYGIPFGLPWREGMMAGESCIAGKDGAILANTGHRAGVAVAQVDLTAPRVQPRSHNQPAGDIRAFHHEDRRPERYRRLVE